MTVSRTYANVPARMLAGHDMYTVEHPSYRRVMREADKCVAAGGHITGFSEYKPVIRYKDHEAPSVVQIEHITITLHEREHPHATFARHRRG
jgi:hypothetical protein